MCWWQGDATMGLWDGLGCDTGVTDPFWAPLPKGEMDLQPWGDGKGATRTKTS